MIVDSKEFQTFSSPARQCIAVAAAFLATMFLPVAAQAGPGWGDSVGEHFELHLSDLPAPYGGPPHLAGAEDIDRPVGWLPKVPPGFHVGIFASDLDRPREIVVGPGGTVFVSQTHAGNVVALRDTNGDGDADARSVFAAGFREPTGLAVEGRALYVADRRAVWRIGFGSDPATPGTRSMVTRPGALGDGGGHITRELVFAPDGKHFYVAIGSLTDVGEDPWPRATIQEFRSDGHDERTYASGLRNPVGLSFYPGTDELYTVVNERDGLGAGLVPDYLTRIDEGGFYGYPYAYLGNHPDPQFGDLRPDLVKATKVPDLLFKPHSVPLGLLFYEGRNFPKDFEGDAIVAMHGPRGAGGAGISLVRVRFHDGRPLGGYETFMTGFGMSDPREVKSALLVWGRPVWLAEAADGSLLVSDDVANVIWRVSWDGPSATEVSKPLAAAGADR